MLLIECEIQISRTIRLQTAQAGLQQLDNLRSIDRREERQVLIDRQGIDPGFPVFVGAASMRPRET